MTEKQRDIKADPKHWFWGTKTFNRTVSFKTR